MEVVHQHKRIFEFGLVYFDIFAGMWAWRDRDAVEAALERALEEGREAERARTREVLVRLRDKNFMFNDDAKIVIDIISEELFK